MNRSVLGLLSSLATITATGVTAHAAAYTWDGGGSDGNTSTALNWSTDVAPAATGDTLTFGGTLNTTVSNNSITSLATSGTAVTFASGAGAFNIGGNALTLGSGAGAGQVIVQQNSTANQTISANINLSGGNGDRSIVFGAGAGSLTLSGNINFSNDWLFPNTTAGTLILSGTNTGDGKGTASITAGGNTMRAMLRNNVAGTQLVLGSDGALGNANSGSAAAGTAALRGIIANQNLSISTANGSRDFSGSTFAINAARLTYNGADNTTIGNIVSTGGNRDLWITSTGNLTAGNVFLSADATGRNLYINVTSTGGAVVNGSVYDTLSNTAGTFATIATPGQLRKAGTGTLTLNGNSAYRATTSIEGGTLYLNGTHDPGAGVNAGRYLVTSGAVLGGTGTIRLSDTTGTLTGVSVSGAVAPGNSIGTLTIDGTNSARSMFSLESGGLLTMELGAGLTSDRLAFTGSAVNDVFFNNNAINFSDLTAGSLSPGNYTLITSDAANTYSGLTLSGSLITGGLTIGTGLSSYPGSTLNLQGNNIVLTIVPEPGAASLALLAALGLVRRRR